MKLHLGKILSLVNWGVTNTAVLSILPWLHRAIYSSRLLLLIQFQEIISKNSSPDSGGGALAPAYLLSLMIDYASKHLDPALLPQLLLKAANQIKGIVWVSIQKSSAVIPNQGYVYVILLF